MKININWLRTVMVVFGVSLLTLSGTHAQASAVVEDSFNNYSNGSVVGQGGWASYGNGSNFIVQGTTVFEGAKALHVNATADSVITKSGSSLSDGRQAVYIRTENRSSWGSYPNGNLQVRVSKGGWTGLQSAIVSFKGNGNVAYYDIEASSQGLDTFTNFATYNDNEWTLLEIEWRSSDNTARYRVNSGAWTSWLIFRDNNAFTNFDTVGFDFNSSGGSGGVYFDFLSNDPTPPTPVPTPTPTLTPTPTPTNLPIIWENFNSYSNGAVVGQGGWYDRANGLPWVVQGSVIQEGAKALYNNNTGADSVITKNNGGNKLANGGQLFYIRTQNRSSWNTRATNFQIGIFQDSWDGPSRATLGFEKDGNVNYVNGSNDARVNFATYVDDAWNLVEMEWRASDASARYRINSGAWTNWIPFTGGGSFTGFDTVGFVTWYLGTGGVYIDSLSNDPTPPTPIPTPTPEPTQAPTPNPTPVPTKTPTPIPVPPTSTPRPPSCWEDTWSCDDWNSCSPQGTQGRNCRKTFECPEAETSSPATSRYCEVATPTPKNTPPNISQDQILKATVRLICIVDIKAGTAKSGSGTIIDSRGTILTNYHVVEGTTGTCLVGFINGRKDNPKFTEVADVKNFSTSMVDAALLKIRGGDSKNFVFIDISRGNSDDLDFGDRITTYGYPKPQDYGAKITFTSGDFSGFGEQVVLNGYPIDLSDYFKTTAAIDHGNSGGGAYINNGTFVGIPTLGGFGHVNYILSINSVKNWINSFASNYNYQNINSRNLNRYFNASDTGLENIDVKDLKLLDAPDSNTLIKDISLKKKAPASTQPKKSPPDQIQKELPSSESLDQKSPATLETIQPKKFWLKRFFLWIADRF